MFNQSTANLQALALLKTKNCGQNSKILNVLRLRVISALIHIDHPVKHEEATTPPFFLPPAKSVPLEAAGNVILGLPMAQRSSINRSMLG